MDVLTEILTRFPPNSRRRFRLVCKLWRDAIDRTTNMESRVKTLVFVGDYSANDSGSYRLSAHIIDDPSSKEGRPREVWSSQPSRPSIISLVGTCNGLLCLTDLADSSITILNPATGETISIPPPPSLSPGTPKAYAFAYSDTREQYKIVHLGCYDTVQVFTLGEPSWRNVRIRLSYYSLLLSSIVTIHGVAYWLPCGSEIMSFDLWTEQITTVQLPQVQAKPGHSFRLVEVCGKLGVVAASCRKTWFANEYRTTESTAKIWVLKSTGWRQWQDVQAQEMDRKLTTPHAALGNYLLTMEDRGSVLYAHRLSNRLLRISKDKPGKVVISNNQIRGAINGTFSFVETKEPLNIYRLNNN